jgi:salicylic acid 3-hydroxylase
MAPGAPKVLLRDIVSNSNEVPSSFIRPASDRPDLCNVVDSSLQSIPVIDMKGLDGPNHQQIINALGSACKTDGFFMVKYIDKLCFMFMALISSSLQSIFF